MLGTGLTHVDINLLIVNWPVTIRKLYETLVVVAWKSSYCRRSLKDHSTGDADLMFLQNRGNDHQNSFRWVVGAAGEVKVDFGTQLSKLKRDELLKVWMECLHK